MRIFWDWDRTLGTKPFWNKLAAEDGNFASRLNELFTSDMVGDWMRGQLSFDEIHRSFLYEYDKDYLRQRLVEDWSIDEVFYENRWNHYRDLYPDAAHYVVTDNMDVFNDFVFAHTPFFERFEKVYNSSDYGALKSDKKSLFSLVKKDLGNTPFTGDLLLDDSSENCDTFQSLGGSAIVVDKAR